MRKVNRSNPIYDGCMEKNKELYDYIYINYTTSPIPVTRRDIADKFDKRLDYVNNFIATHNLCNKYRDNPEERVFKKSVMMDLDEIGYTRTEIADVFGLFPSRLSILLGKKNKGDEENEGE